VLNISIVTISDRASNGVYEDKSGPAINDAIKEWIISESHISTTIIPDDLELIKSTLISQSMQNSLILTTGGTGPAKRDVTPEATEDICHKLLPGYGEIMRTGNFKRVPTSINSRQTAGIRGRCLIVNLPGKPKAIRECLELILPAIADCISLIAKEKPELHEKFQHHHHH
jgi:molybdopterin adenylyltransferase